MMIAPRLGVEGAAIEGRDDGESRMDLSSES